MYTQQNLQPQLHVFAIGGLISLKLRICDIFLLVETGCMLTSILDPSDCAVLFCGCDWLNAGL